MKSTMKLTQLIKVTTFLEWFSFEFEISNSKLFTLLRSMIGLLLKNSRHLYYSTNHMQNQNQSRLAHTRFPALASTLIGSYILLYMLTFVAIVGLCNCFGFAVTTLNWKLKIALKYLFFFTDRSYFNNPFRA